MRGRWLRYPRYPWYLALLTLLVVGAGLWRLGAGALDPASTAGPPRPASSAAPVSPVGPRLLPRHVAFQGHVYAVTDVDLRRYDIVMTASEGQRQSYPDVLADLRAAGIEPLLLTNGGIYGTQNQPLGLLISRSRTQHDVATGPGEGNFYRDSAIFQVSGEGVASIVPARGWSAPPGIVAATQSGPQLAAAGKVNPGVRPGSPAVFVRTAVGVDGADRRMVRLVVSRDRVTLFELARLLIDELHCQEALHLDGDLSALFVPSEPDRFVFSDPGPRIVTALSVVARRLPSDDAGAPARH
jgi:uncharacterized protein YigE (DUF2233 family)